MPVDLDMEECAPGLFDRDAETGQMDSLATVLLQEVDRFNGLLEVLRRSLGLLRKAIKVRPSKLTVPGSQSSLHTNRYRFFGWG